MYFEPIYKNIFLCMILDLKVPHMPVYPLRVPRYPCILINFTLHTMYVFLQYEVKTKRLCVIVHSHKLDFYI